MRQECGKLTLGGALQRQLAAGAEGVGAGVGWCAPDAAAPPVAKSREACAPLAAATLRAPRNDARVRVLLLQHVPADGCGFQGSSAEPPAMDERKPARAGRDNALRTRGERKS